MFLSSGVTRFDFWLQLISQAMMWRMGCWGGDQSGGCCKRCWGLGQDDMSGNKKWRVGAAFQNWKWNLGLGETLDLRTS